MSRELVFLPVLRQDLIEAFNYYEALLPGRGGDHFEAAFKQALRQIESGVITHLEAFKHFHRVVLPGFPYNLYYRLFEDRAVITGLLYDPRRIQETLMKRM
jgi:hypothetical protein